MVFVSPRRGNVIGISNTTTITTNIVDFFKKLPSSSYMVFDSGYKYIYDKYNDVYRYIPCNGDTEVYAYRLMKFQNLGSHPQDSNVVY